MAGDRIDPWASDTYDYGRLIEQFGIEPFDLDRFPLPDPPAPFRRGVVFGHRGFPSVHRAISAGTPFAVLTGLAPSARSLLYLAVTLAYGGVWLAVALFFSTVFKSPTTSALAAIGLWLFLSVFWGMIAGLLAPVLSPVHCGFQEEVYRQAQTERMLARVAPNTLYAEATLALLRPEVRSLGPVLPAQLEGMVLGTPLPLGQSLLLVWPQFAGLVAASVLFFTLAYVLFQRAEIRA